MDEDIKTQMAIDNSHPINPFIIAFLILAGLFAMYMFLKNYHLTSIKNDNKKP